MCDFEHGGTGTTLKELMLTKLNDMEVETIESKMFSGKSRCSAGRIISLLLSLIILTISGCGSLESSNLAEIDRFNQAGAITPRLDSQVMAASCWQNNQYRLVCGDVVNLEMPAIMKVSTSELPEWTGKRDPYSCRVDNEGKIYLPVLGGVYAAGLTLSELETRIAQGYYPRFVVNYPSVVASIATYQTNKVSIVGAVEKSGVYELRVDQMSLINLLMKAGGVNEDGASVIRVRHGSDGHFSQPLVLPVEGMNVPFEDIALLNGDTVVVEKLVPQYFTVVGLVERPGAFPFGPGEQYNVMQAIAFAGGVDDVADPHYVRLYRQDSNGEIVSVLLPLIGKEANQTLSVMLKPGDIVAVDHTARTRTRTLLSEIVNLNFGVQAMYRMDKGDNIY